MRRRVDESSRASIHSPGEPRADYEDSVALEPANPAAALRASTHSLRECTQDKERFYLPSTNVTSP
jgi:hypothetical protein